MMSEPSSAPPSAPFSFHLASLSRIGRLIRKETLSILRDRRTIITLILMPLLLYPLLSIAFQQFLLGSMPVGDQLQYVIGFPTGEERAQLSPYLLLGLESLASKRTPWPVGYPPDQPLPELKTRDEDISEPESAVFAGSIHVALRPAGFRATPPLFPGEVRSADALPETPLPPQAAKVGSYVFQLFRDREVKSQWELLYREDQAISREAAAFIQHVLAAANAEVLSARLRNANVQQAPAPVFAAPIVMKEHNVSRTASLAVLVPLILILMTMTGAVYPAIDLTAGERERGTLETLVAAPIPRFSLLFAKYIAVLIVAVLTASANLLIMTVTLLLNGLGRVFGAQGLTVLSLVEVFGLMLLLAAFFSAVLLVITSFARSFKEAQAYLIPLMLAALLPGMLPLLDPKLSLDGPCAVAPLLNIVLLARDLFSGQTALTSAVMVVLSTLFYAVAAVAVAARLFGAEAVLYSEQSGWGDLFRRPKEPRPVATLSAALFCLALMFPLCFLLNGLQFVLVGRPLMDRLALGGLNTLMVFGGLPLLWAWTGHVQFRPGFQFSRPTLLACLGAILLGISLWPFIHDLVVLMRNLGLMTVQPELQHLTKEALTQWRTVSPFWIVLAFAILPAIFEELTFRGYLFTAVKEASGPRTAIVVSSVLFGLFHLVLGNSLSLDRLVPATLLGFVLALVAWRSGSVVPGILLHVLHNSCLVLMGYYEPELQQQSWVPQGEGYLPIVWLLGGAWRRRWEPLSSCGDENANCPERSRLRLFGPKPADQAEGPNSRDDQNDQVPPMQAKERPGLATSHSVVANSGTIKKKSYRPCSKNEMSRPSSMPANPDWERNLAWPT